VEIYEAFWKYADKLGFYKHIFGSQLSVYVKIYPNKKYRTFDE
jgi:hypothetical protein